MHPESPDLPGEEPHFDGPLLSCSRGCHVQSSWCWSARLCKVDYLYRSERAETQGLYLAARQTASLVQKMRRYLRGQLAAFSQSGIIVSRSVSCSELHTYVVCAVADADGEPCQMPSRNQVTLCRPGLPVLLPSPIILSVLSRYIYFVCLLAHSPDFFSRKYFNNFFKEIGFFCIAPVSARS